MEGAIFYMYAKLNESIFEFPNTKQYLRFQNL